MTILHVFNLFCMSDPTHETYKPGGKKYCEMFREKAEERLQEIEKKFQSDVFAQDPCIAHTKIYRWQQEYGKLLKDLVFIKANAEVCKC